MKRNLDLNRSRTKQRLGVTSGALLLSFALVGGACASAGSPAGEASTTHPPVSTPDSAPDIGTSIADRVTPSTTDTPSEPTATSTCVDGLPDAEMECGRLIVPVDYDRPDGDSYSLPYVVLPALGDSPSAEPMVFLQGGPGASTLATVDLFVDDPTFRQDRDLIFLEQRGTDPSGIFLSCELELISLRNCYDSYVADGIDLSSFTTLNAARDLATLRSELDIERWHLLGGSYGTTLAMVAMDNDPTGTASVILDAPTAPDVIIYNADTESLLDAYSNIFTKCDAAPECSDRYSDLFAKHLANFEQLTVEPWNIAGTELVQDFGPTIDHISYFVVSAEMVIGDPAVLPAFVTAVNNRDVDAVLALSDAGEDDSDQDSAATEPEVTGPTIAVGLNHSIYCAEEAPFFDLDTNPIETVDEWPAEIVDFLLSVFLQDCDVWDVEPATLSDVDQVRSSIPTLILAGEYDHTTPIRQGRIAAAGLDDVELIEVPSTGHTTLDNDCARRIMADFLRAPGGDRSCLADIARLAWR